MIQKSEYRKTLGTFSTGVTIITTQSEGGFYGFTANSFTSVSLDPPLVLFCVNKAATFVEALSKSKIFGINILAVDQEALSNRFANSALVNDERFEGVSYQISDSGCPIIDGSLAFLDCEQYKISAAGTHQIVMGKVKMFARLRHGSPLVYFGGGYRSIDQL